MGKSSLAPGFRFKPTDVELVKYYLKRKLMGKRFHLKAIGELDVYKYEPWDLPDKSCWESGDLKWYFFCPREKRYQNGTKMKRATQGGYWKTTGKDRSVFYSGEVVGWIKTLVFHVGRAPGGNRTDWVMHEYRLVDQALADRGVSLDSYVLCIIFHKEGLGPRNGAQYGVPFKEEDWSDDGVEIVSEVVQDGSIPKPALGLPCTYNSLIANANSPDIGTHSAAGQGANMPESDLGIPCSYNSSISTNTHSPQDIGIGPSGSCISDILALCKVVQPVPSNYVTVGKPHASDLSMFDSFTEENAFFITGNGEGKAGICSEAIPNAKISELEVMLPSNYNGSIATSSTHFIEGIGMSPYESCISDIVPPPCNVLQLEAGTTLHKHPGSNGDDIHSIFDSFTEFTEGRTLYGEENKDEGCLKAVPTGNTPEAYLRPANKYISADDTGTHTTEVIDLGPSFESCRYESDKTEERNRFNHFGKAEDTRSMYECLRDLGSLSSVIEDGYYFSSGHTPVANFLELGDLEDHGDLFGFN